ncbi:MAG: transposase zinc-binding domain-containing protein [Acidobacteriota bacterium]|nr:MAG: transposase zinc-binding domain-containing protein [Acidobacteriota bacterium]
MPAAAPSTVYRPRHPERSDFYEIFEQHFERYLSVYDERYEPRWGPLRPVVRPAVERFLDCGRLQGGFARVRCERCGAEHLLAFSCSCRNFCPSCQAKRAALFAEKLVNEVLERVAHQHLVLTIPRAIRGLFRRDRRLLGILARSAYDAIRKTCEATLERQDLRPAAVLSIQTFGSFANYHPHIHAVLAKGCFGNAGAFHPIPELNTAVIEEVFRRLVLGRLNRAKRLSQEFMQNLLSWEHSGFSARLGVAIGADDRAGLERLVRYIVRVPVPAGTVRIAGRAVIVCTPPDPRTGATQLSLDPLPRGRTVRRTVRHASWTRNARPTRSGDPSFTRSRRRYPTAASI